MQLAQDRGRWPDYLNAVKNIRVSRIKWNYYVRSKCGNAVLGGATVVRAPRTASPSAGRCSNEEHTVR